MDKQSDMAAVLAGLAATDQHMQADDRAWVAGVARLSGWTDPSVLSHETAQHVLRLCVNAGIFPSGPLRWSAQAGLEQETDEYRATALRVAGGKDPHLETRVAFAMEGYLGVISTRSGVIDASQGEEPGHVLLADIEAACADIMVIASTTSKIIGYDGRVDLAVGLVCHIPGHPAVVRLLDTEEATPVPFEGIPDVFEPVTGSFLMSDPDGSRYDEAYRMATVVTRRYGIDAPQYLMAPERIDWDEVHRGVAEAASRM